MLSVQYNFAWSRHHYRAGHTARTVRFPPEYAEVVVSSRGQYWYSSVYVGGMEKTTVQVAVALSLGLGCGLLLGIVLGSRRRRLLPFLRTGSVGPQ